MRKYEPAMIAMAIMANEISPVFSLTVLNFMKARLLLYHTLKRRPLPDVIPYPS
jgi:hypothetical protein